MLFITYFTVAEFNMQCFLNILPNFIKQNNGTKKLNYMILCFSLSLPVVPVNSTSFKIMKPSVGNSALIPL